MANRFYRLGAATITGADEPTLRLGSSGDWVTKLQMRLNASGASGGNLPMDGNFTAETEQQLKNFQAAYGLTVDGIAGADTWAKLVEVTGQPLPKTAGAGKVLRMDPLLIQGRVGASGFDWEPWALGAAGILGAVAVWKALS